MTVCSEVSIEARAVDFSYPGEEDSSGAALSGINLALKRGEYIALIGPNGSGKTTLLKLFNALLTPSSGEVLVEGLSTSEEENLPEIRRRCGMIFQNPDNQLVATTVEEDIAFGLENLALPSAEIRVKVQHTARLLGLSHLLRQPPHLLSGGEKQRVAIAGILAMEPDFILMDEPTAMLDPAGRREVLKTVAELNRRRGLGIIHVTHSPAEAALAGRVVVLDSGRLREDGTPREVLTDLALLHGLGLQGTAAVELAALLREDGFALDPQTLHSRELVESLCLLVPKN
ncbi:MAG TPA: energy-coupling factor transporter ATPase [Firmicutes bacterium]|nr:energy-coupling factor transporter ATPase [Bacillota bacterium]